MDNHHVKQAECLSYVLSAGRVETVKKKSHTNISTFYRSYISASIEADNVITVDNIITVNNAIMTDNVINLPVL